MDGIHEGAEANPYAHIDRIQERIADHCSGPDGEGVYLFPSSVRLSETPSPEARREYAANAVFDGLMVTLNEIGSYAAEKAKGTGEPAKDYETVLRAIDPLSGACRAFADGTLPLRRNTYAETRHAEVGDRVHAYGTGPFALGETRYRGATVFIRPQKYIQPLEVRQNPKRTPGLEVQEYSQARFSLKLVPEDASTGEIALRVDREDALHNYGITYDLEIRPNGENILDQLEFPTETTGQVQSHASSGHHFESHYTAEHFGVKFSEILETFDAKIQQSIGAPQSAPDTQAR